MNKLGFLAGVLTLVGTTMTYGQGAKNIVINEVMTNNTSSILDEFGERDAWVELENVSFTTYNIRGMYLTTDRHVLDKALSAPERIKLMSLIPNGEHRTSLGGKQHIVFFLNSTPTKGKLHLSASIPLSEPVWVALYNGNGTELIDSVTVPALAADQSFARNGKKWTIKAADAVTPNTENFIRTSESKVTRLKREDPHGFGITILAMGIVFSCLAVLFIFFSLFGLLMRHMETARKVVNKQPIKPITRTVEKTAEIGHKTNVILQDGLKTKGIDKEIYMAVIAMALKQYEDDVHDVESGIITIKPKTSEWNNEFLQMTQFHE